MKKMKYVTALILIFIFSVTVSAQQFQMIPVTPPTPSSHGLMQPSIPGQQMQQPSQAQPVQQLLPPRVPYVEKPSAFEEFISGKPVEVTDLQLGILKKLEGITFQYSSKNLPKDVIAVAIKVLSFTQQTEPGKGAAQSVTPSPVKELQILLTPIIVDAGFLVGTPGAIAAAFKLTGIKV